ncbi:unnamed protein product [Peronospora belbahrii]|uniref:Uncharacterized protein n=1 Tax=Peronospora belbahrii TaxID=622444 RepID=A0ABN8CVW2_9STRA|nr:unnamed protein product [Peronospora belbahrii]
MALPDAVEARRIAAQLATLEQQRAEGNLPYDTTPLRLYQVQTGGFVRVLDQHPEPISQGMLQAIDTFIKKHQEREDLDEMKANMDGKQQEEEEEEKEEEKTVAGQETVTVAGDMEQKRREKSVDAVARFLDQDIATTVCDTVTDVDEEIVEKTESYDASISVDCAPPWETASVVKTPQELLAQNERVSDFLCLETLVEDQKLLSGQENARNDGHPVDKALNDVSEPVDNSMLLDQWPPQLEERRRLWFAPQNSSRRTCVIGAKNQSIVYWMHNTLRVTQGNYGLEAAIMLSRRLAAPLVVVCLVSVSVIYPVCHATTASDAYARYSLVELYQQFKQAGIPFYGITAKEFKMSTTSNDQQNSLSLKPNPLYELLDGFEPHAVVADAMFDPPSRRDMVHLARYLNLNRSSCSWSFMSMDSTTCCPAYQLSPKLQRTFERGAAFASEEQFGAEYASFSQPRNGTYVFSPLPRVSTLDRVVDSRRLKVINALLQRLHMEEINWQVVKAENAQSSSQMRRFSEGEGLQKLSQLLADSDSHPAIQTELRGGGVLSLLPFIRHGTLFAGYVLQRISESIDLCPTPTASQERKALAMRKVMRSRAAKHFGIERDYVLYLSLWSTAAAAGGSFDPSEPTQPDITLSSTSEIIAGLKMSAPRSSSLDIYRKLLPAWAYSAVRIAEESKVHVTDAALYDPYELECARTKDLYWNEIQKMLVEQQYLHPLLVVYWAYRVLTWSVSCRAAIATIESLISQCALGSASSPDAVLIVWKQLFRLGSSSINATISSNMQKTSHLEELRQFQLILESELASQPKLQLRP